MPLPDKYVQNKLKAYFSSQIQVLCQDTNPHYFPSPVLLCIFKSNLFAYLPGSQKRVSPPGRWHGHRLQTSHPCPLPACCQRVFKNKTEVIGGEGTDEELGRSCIAEQSGFVCFISYQAHSSLCKLPGDKLQLFFLSGASWSADRASPAAFAWPCSHSRTVPSGQNALKSTLQRSCREEHTSTVPYKMRMDLFMYVFIYVSSFIFFTHH